jgi:hypothetical protein
MKIELIDINGDRAYAISKGDTYANTYLTDRNCYELHKIIFNKG